MQRWIPQNSVEIAHPDGLGVVYQYTNKGRTCAIAYARKASKPAWNLAFYGQMFLDRRVKDFFEGLTQRAKDVIERRAAASQPHPLKVDDIVVNSWGWEQTNVDFYKVTKVSACYVWLISIGSKEVPGSAVSHGMACRVVADPTWIDPKGVTTMHKADRHGNVGFKHGSGGRWDGKEQYRSWYA